MMHIHSTELTTPRRVTSSIKRFLSSLEISATPLFLRYTPISDQYQAGRALENCEVESKRSGDPIVYGWILWEDRVQAVIEAQFHAVIKRKGELINITPQPNDDDLVLFVVDKNRSAEHLEDGTWQTWCNHKAQGGNLIHAAHPIEVQDSSEASRHEHHHFHHS